MTHTDTLTARVLTQYTIIRMSQRVFKIATRVSSGFPWVISSSAGSFKREGSARDTLHELMKDGDTFV